MKVKILIPKPQKYHLRYQTKAGEIKDYTISVPIEDAGDSFTAYAFGHGIRSFIKSQVIDLQ